MSQVPATGRIVHYKLSPGDVGTIALHRQSSPGRGGNAVEAGQVFPAIIVRTWGDTPESAVQLQVFLDGNDTYWATSRTQGDSEGHWSWPPRT